MTAAQKRTIARQVAIGLITVLSGSLVIAVLGAGQRHVVGTTQMRHDFDRYVVLDSVWRASRLRNDSIQSAMNLDILCSPMIRPTDRRC